jgi:hypothetical protein
VVPTGSQQVARRDFNRVAEKGVAIVTANLGPTRSTLEATKNRNGNAGEPAVSSLIVCQSTERRLNRE